MADPGFKSVGRGAPVAADLRNLDIVGAALRRPFPANLPANLPIPVDLDHPRGSAAGLHPAGAGSASQRACHCTGGAAA